jgi:hypothetical protein
LNDQFSDPQIVHKRPAQSRDLAVSRDWLQQYDKIEETQMLQNSQNYSDSMFKAGDQVH